MLVLTYAASTGAAQTCSLVAPDHVENPAGFPNHGVPDSEIAVGTELVLTCSNSWLRLLDKSSVGLPLQAKLGDYDDPTYPAFFPVNAPPISGEFHLIGDPMVHFDYEDERFWVVALEGRGTLAPFPWTYSHIHIAVSTDATPDDWDASWLKFDYCMWEDGGCSNINGFAHNFVLAVGGDTVYISLIDDEGGDDKATTLMMLDKDELMAGNAPTPVFLHLDESPINEQTWGHAVAVEYDAWDNDDPVYAVAPGEPPNTPTPNHQDTILVGTIVKDGSTFTYENFALRGGGLPDWFDTDRSAATPNNDVTLIAGRFLHATYRPDPEGGGRIYTCHHVRENVGTSQSPTPGTRNIVRWYVIHTNGWPEGNDDPSLESYGEIIVADAETYDPSIAVDAAGNVALSWTQSGTEMYPEFWMGVHRAGIDSPGVLGITALQQDSSVVRSIQSIDYSGTDPDPTEPCRFWGHSALGTDMDEWTSYVVRLCWDCSCDCFADQDGNGTLDTLDTMLFMSRLASGDTKADCNKDGVLDVHDATCFEAIYSAGCGKK